jgi:hypothetical protein
MQVHILNEKKTGTLCNSRGRGSHSQSGYTIEEIKKIGFEKKDICKRCMSAQRAK